MRHKPGQPYIPQDIADGADTFDEWCKAQEAKVFDRLFTRASAGEMVRARTPQSRRIGQWKRTARRAKQRHASDVLNENTRHLDYTYNR